MKNIIFTSGIAILLVFCFLPAYVIAEDIPLAREILVQKKDTSFRYTYYYDDDHNPVIEDITKSKQATKRTEWLYDASGRQILQREMDWENNDWQTKNLLETQYIADKKSQEIYKYITQGLETVAKIVNYAYLGDKISSIETTNDDNSAYKTLYTYDAENRLKTIAVIHGVLVQDTVQFIEYKYHPEMALDSVISYKIEENQRNKEYLTIYRYDKISSLLSSQTNKRWNDNISNWQNETRLTYSYNSDAEMNQETAYYHNSLFWVPILRYENTYEDQQLAEKVTYRHIYNDWRKISTIEYLDKYYGQPNLMESKYNFWGGETGTYAHNIIPYYFNGSLSLMQADRMEIKYVLDTGTITNNINQVDFLNVYPNPSYGLFYINPKDHKINSWKVYNANGMVVQAAINEYDTGIVDMTNLPEGIYLIDAYTDENKQLRQKLIIHKNY